MNTLPAEVGDRVFVIYENSYGRIVEKDNFAGSAVVRLDSDGVEVDVPFSHIFPGPSDSLSVTFNQ